jgi:thymidylate synthase
MNTIDSKYQELLQDILDNGVEKGDRTGTGTISVFGRQIRHKMSQGFPLLTTKKMAWKTMVTELLWFLRGDTNIKFLLDYDCHIWDGDAYKNFQKTCQFEIDANHILPNEWMSMRDDFMSSNILTQEEFINKIKTDDEFAKQWGELGPIYGKQWRKWTQYEIDMPGFDAHFDETKTDQIQNLINELKTNPDSRRLMVNTWNVGELDQMVLPPCHYGFQVYTRELSIEERLDLASKKYEVFDPFDFHVVDHNEIDKLYPVPKRTISLMWNQRSVDTFLGLPFNIASYALLLEIIAKEVNMIPEDLIGNLGDVHLYKNHIEQAKEQISREPYDLPAITITERNWYMHEKVKEHLGPKSFNDKILSYRPDCFELVNYQSHPKIKAPLSN